MASGILLYPELSSRIIAKISEEIEEAKKKEKIIVILV